MRTIKLKVKQKIDVIKSVFNEYVKQVYLFLKIVFIPANLLALAALAVSIVSLQINKRMEGLSERQNSTSVDLSHFVTLLKKTDRSISEQEKLLYANESLATLSRSQIDSLVSINKTLTQQFEIISRQYSLSSIQESDIRKEKKIELNSDWNHFYVSTELLSSGIQYYLRSDSTVDSLRETQYLTDVLNTLKSEIYNPVLMKSDSVSRYWMGTYSFIKMVKDEISEPYKFIVSTDGRTVSRGEDVKEHFVKIEFRLGIKRLANLTVMCDMYMIKNSDILPMGK